jgi:hypothetical protein
MSLNNDIIDKEENNDKILISKIEKIKKTFINEANDINSKNQVIKFLNKNFNLKIL